LTHGVYHIPVLCEWKVSGGCRKDTDSRRRKIEGDFVVPALKFIRFLSTNTSDRVPCDCDRVDVCVCGIGPGLHSSL
jgi:hypothetical protein